jgi:hypothetical protein
MAAERAATTQTMIQTTCGNGQAAGGQHGSAESKWHSKDGMLPLDHFQSGSDVGKR